MIESIREMYVELVTTTRAWENFQRLWWCLCKAWWSRWGCHMMAHYEPTHPHHLRSADNGLYFKSQHHHHILEKNDSNLVSICFCPWNRCLEVRASCYEQSKSCRSLDGPGWTPIRCLGMLHHLGPGCAQSLAPDRHRRQYVECVMSLSDFLFQLWGNVLGMKRMKTGEFVHMLTHSCLGMPII